MEPTQQESKKGNNLWISGLIVAVIAAGFGVMKYMKGGSAGTNVADNQNQVPVSGNTADGGVQVATASTYKDGTYSAVGSYNSPGGAEEIGVTLTLKNNIVIDASAVSRAFRPESKNYQGIFVNNFKSYVVGKNIDQIKLDKVSGSSLTPQGFNDALEKIKAEARV